MAPIEAEKERARKWKIRPQVFPRFFSPTRPLQSLGVSQRMPAMAAKDSCKLTEAAAKGFASRIKNRAASRDVGPSLSRRARMASRGRDSMTQARSTEGLPSVRTA